MARRKLLAELDHTKLPNLKNLSPDFVDLYYNVGQKFAVPYTWGTSGLAYNKKKIPNPPTKWADLFDVEKLKPLKGRISILDDAREVAGAALLALGLDPNTKNKEDLDKAAVLLRRQKPFLAKYDSASAEDSVASGETWLAQGFSGDIATAQAENPDIGYIIPEEGVTFFVDNLCLLQESKNKEAATKLLDYLLRPEVALANMNAMKFASTVGGLKDEDIDEALKGSAALLLPPKEKRVLFKDPGQEMGDAFEALFNDLKNYSRKNGILLEFPKFSKKQIVKISKSKDKLPAGISRHILDNRVLHVKYDINKLKDDKNLEGKKRDLDRYLLGKIDNNKVRQYRESVIVFDE
jgi:spermidine/putrescine-binding protein